jgi:hypothetical protein
MPSAYTSALGDTMPWSRYSGAMYPRVPAIRLVIVNTFSPPGEDEEMARAAANPRSLARRPLVTSMCAGRARRVRVLVQVPERLRHVERHPHPRRPAQAAEPVAERAVLSELVDEVPPAGVVAEADEADEVVVVELPRDVHLRGHVPVDVRPRRRRRRRTWRGTRTRSMYGLDGGAGPKSSVAERSSA